LRQFDAKPSDYRNFSGEGGIRTPRKNGQKSTISVQGGAENGAPATIDADLALVNEAWPALPPAIKAGILALVEASKTGCG
jgi:hypothetical protein